jgi:hypothetical protein
MRSEAPPTVAAPNPGDANITPGLAYLVLGTLIPILQHLVISTSANWFEFVALKSTNGVCGFWMELSSGDFVFHAKLAVAVNPIRAMRLGQMRYLL